MNKQFDRDVTQLGSADERRSSASTDGTRTRQSVPPAASSRGLAPIALADYELAGRLYMLTIC